MGGGVAEQSPGGNEAAAEKQQEREESGGQTAEMSGKRCQSLGTHRPQTLALTLRQPHTGFLLRHCPCFPDVPHPAQAVVIVTIISRAHWSL